MKKRPIPQLCSSTSTCCGCTACMTICPIGAITMRPDENGFPVPQIDEEKCLRCGKCLQACAFKEDGKQTPLTNEAAFRVYAVRAKNPDIVSQSSSGGVFTVLSDYILDVGGVVASAVYDYSSHQQVFQLYGDRKTRDQARGSKYIHPTMGNVYAQCVGWMKENPDRPLMFVGLGCQVAGFTKVLKANRIEKQAILVDIICHGVPSPKLWYDYIHWLQDRHGGTATYVTFKDKRNGWENPLAFARIGGKEILLSEYCWWFYENYAQRSSCFNCPYTHIRRNSDITIGDFWGVQNTFPDFYSPKGNSLVLIQSKKGNELFDKIKNRMDWAEGDEMCCMQPRLISPGQANPNRERFWNDYRKGGVAALIKRHHEDGKVLTFLKKCANRAKRAILK